LKVVIHKIRSHGGKEVWPSADKSGPHHSGAGAVTMVAGAVPHQIQTVPADAPDSHRAMPGISRWTGEFVSQSLFYTPLVLRETASFGRDIGGPVGSRGSAPGQGSGRRSPQKLKAFCFTSGWFWGWFGCNMQIEFGFYVQ